MQATLIALAVMLSLAGTAQAQGVANCEVLSAPVASVLPTALAPVSEELMAPRHQLGSPSGVLAQAFDDSLSVDQVLYRNKLAACATFASVTPALVPGALPASPESALPVVPGTAGTPAATDPAAYVPRTEFDNAPWRFDMNQNGKRMTADEFTAWMEAKGVRVVKPRAPVASAIPVGGQAPGSIPAEGQAPGPTPAVAPSPATPPAAGADQPTP